MDSLDLLTHYRTTTRHMPHAWWFPWAKVKPHPLSTVAKVNMMWAEHASLVQGVHKHGNLEFCSVKETQLEGWGYGLFMSNNWTDMFATTLKAWEAASGKLLEVESFVCKSTQDPRTSLLIALHHPATAQQHTLSPNSHLDIQSLTILIGTWGKYTHNST